MVELTSGSELFKGRQFDQEIIVLCVRWYLSFKPSSRDLVQRFPKRCGSHGERDFSFHAASTTAQIPDTVFGLPASFPLLN